MSDEADRLKVLTELTTQEDGIDADLYARLGILQQELRAVAAKALDNGQFENSRVALISAGQLALLAHKTAEARIVMRQHLMGDHHADRANPGDLEMADPDDGIDGDLD